MIEIITCFKMSLDFVHEWALPTACVLKNFVSISIFSISSNFVGHIQITLFFFQPGITTDDIDELAHRLTIESGAYPSPLHYSGFPKSVCTSVNNVVVHGIPDLRPLQDGDIVNVDVTVSKSYLEGYRN